MVIYDKSDLVKHGITAMMSYLIMIITLCDIV